MSESNKWFRNVWNRFDRLKEIEDSWVDVFNDKVEDEILNRYHNIDEKYNGKNRKSKYRFRK